MKLFEVFNMAPIKDIWGSFEYTPVYKLPWCKDYNRNRNGRPTWQGMGQQWRLEESELVATENRIIWAVNTFMPCKVPRQMASTLCAYRMDLTSQSSTWLRYSDSLTMGHILIPRRDVRKVLKPGKEPSLAKSYRSISLSSFMLKTVERQLDRFLRENTLVRYPLSEFQHAYQAGKSNSLVTKMESSTQTKQYTLAGFTDIHGVFDSTTFAAIHVALERRNASKTMIK